MIDYFAALRALVQPIRADNWELTLDPMRRLIAALDEPQQAYRAVVVTGSTGKGTTCGRIARRLSASGLRVGLYTSPHLHLFRERFGVIEPNDPTPCPSPTSGRGENLSVSPENLDVGAHGGAPAANDLVGARHASPVRMITRAEFVEMAQIVLAAERGIGGEDDHVYSTFERATALALLWFAQQQIDVAVLEVGIGGRFDAVNVVANDLAVFTPIEAEHVAILGGSLESVAWHKAGIIQPGGKAISVAQSAEVWAMLEHEAQEKGATLEIDDNVLASLGDLTPRSPLHVMERGRLPQEAGSEVNLPGRLERISMNGRAVVIDGGHTPQAARHLREFLGDAESIRLIVGMLRDKNVAAYLSSFDAPNVHLIYTRAPSDRALSPDDLLVRYRPQAAQVTLIDSLDETLAGVDQADEALIVVAGSLRMAAAAREAFGLLSPEEADEARITHTIFEGAAYRSKLGKK